MTKRKEVANTLTNVINVPIVKAIMDKSTFVPEAVIEETLSFWNYDLFTKKFGVAYKIDGAKFTKLDLATFFYALVNRNAVINIPSYKSARPTKTKSNQVVLAKTNRHGQCLGLTSNKEVFSFGVRINDMNVMTIKDEKQDMGAYRTYLLTGFDGNLYDGWKKIDFVPTAKENAFLTEKNVWDNNQITFDRFVAPEKWQAFYGQYYFMAKTMIDRLIDERKYIKAAIKEMLDNEIKFPSGTLDEREEFTWPEQKEEDYDTVKVWCFEAEVDIPENDMKYPKIEATSNNLLDMHSRVKRVNRYIEKLRFLTRSIEFAFASKHDHEVCDEDEFMYPNWIKNFGWERDFILPGKRAKWYRLKIMQPGVGQLSVAIRFRWLERSQKIKKEEYVLV